MLPVKTVNIENLQTNVYETVITQCYGRPFRKALTTDSVGMQSVITLLLHLTVGRENYLQKRNSYLETPGKVKRKYSCKLWRILCF